MKCRVIFTAVMAILALGLTVPHAARAEDGGGCTKSFSDAAAKGGDLKAASILLDKAGSCCSTDIDASSAQNLAGSIRTLVDNARSSAAQGGNSADVGKVLSEALGCAGQPSIVAVDPSLYALVLADASTFAELARDQDGGDGGLNVPLQPARRGGALPNNNQQPTVSIEQK